MAPAAAASSGSDGGGLLRPSINKTPGLNQKYENMYTEPLHVKGRLVIKWRYVNSHVMCYFVVSSPLAKMHYHVYKH